MCWEEVEFRLKFSTQWSFGSLIWAYCWSITLIWLAKSCLALFVFFFQEIICPLRLAFSRFIYFVFFSTLCLFLLSGEKSGRCQRGGSYKRNKRIQLKSHIILSFLCVQHGGFNKCRMRNVVVGGFFFNYLHLFKPMKLDFCREFLWRVAPHHKHTHAQFFLSAWRYFSAWCLFNLNPNPPRTGS